jgi:hypothetical protein
MLVITANSDNCRCQAPAGRRCRGLDLDQQVWTLSLCRPLQLMCPVKEVVCSLIKLWRSHLHAWVEGHRQAGTIGYNDRESPSIREQSQTGQTEWMHVQF